MCFSSRSSLIQQYKSVKVCWKRGVARIIQAGAASVDLCPKYTHASGGQECGPPKLIVRISGGYMYCLHGTAVWKLKPCSVGLTSLSQTGGRGRGGLGGRACPQTAQLTACQTDKQWQAADTFFHTEAHVWTEAVAGGSTSSRPCLRAAERVFIYRWKLQWAKFHQRFWNYTYCISLFDESTSTVLRSVRHLHVSFAYPEISIKQLKKQ